MSDGCRIGKCAASGAPRLRCVWQSKRKRASAYSGAERHADRMAELERAVFDSDGVTDRAARAAAALSEPELAPQLAAYLERVRESSYRITDADLAMIRDAGCSEEEIFELTIAAALGAARARLDAGLRAIRSAP